MIYSEKEDFKFKLFENTLVSQSGFDFCTFSHLSGTQIYSRPALRSSILGYAHRSADKLVCTTTYVNNKIHNTTLLNNSGQKLELRYDKLI